MQASKNASQFVEGLEYPASKSSILAAARATSVGPTVQEALNKLPDREYADAEDLTQALNAE
ncbi:MAG: DUF2795 domain-containing protein [Candidatus Limnocylindria bacterium]